MLILHIAFTQRQDIWKKIVSHLNESTPNTVRDESSETNETGGFLCWKKNKKERNKERINPVAVYFDQVRMAFTHTTHNAYICLKRKEFDWMKKKTETILGWFVSV